MSPPIRVVDQKPTLLEQIEAGKKLKPVEQRNRKSLVILYQIIFGLGLITR